MATVTYGNFNFSQVCGDFTPFVGVSDEQVLVGGKWKVLKRVTIQGRIYSNDNGLNCPNSSIITSKIQTLFAGCKNDFVALNAGGINLPIARCDSIEVSQSNFFATADFTANFTGYPEDFSFTEFNVLSPTDTKEIVQNRDGTISMRRNISARGISTSQAPNAITNARNFIQSLNPDQAPNIFFNIGQLQNPKGFISPRKKVETINRIDGSVSVEIEFIYRPTGISSSILSYSVDVNYDDKSGIYSASINGSITGPLNSTLASLKTEFNKISVFNLIKTKFTDMTGEPYLNSIPEQYSITENIENNSINFNYTYVSDPFDPKVSINSSITYDFEKDITNVSLGGNIIARGPQKSLETKIEGALSKLNFWNIANDFALKNMPLDKKMLNPLSKIPTNYTINRKKYDNCTYGIDFNVSYSNEFIDYKEELFQISYTITVDPSIDIYNPVQFLDGKNGIFDMSFFKRCTVSINGSAIGKTNNLSLTVKSYAEEELKKVSTALGILTSNRIRYEDNITTNIYSDNGFQYNFTISDNGEMPPEIIE